MTIDARIEISSSAKGSGFRFVRSEAVAVVSVISVRDDDHTPLALVLRVCVSKFSELLRGWLRSLPDHRILLFVATPSSPNQNAVSRRRGVWTDDLKWLDEVAMRSPSVEVSGATGSRYAALIEIDERQLPDAAEFVRTHSSSFILVSARHRLDEDAVRSIADKVLPQGQPTLDWAEVVAQIDAREDVCIRITGNFDDREVSIDAFVSTQLLNRLSIP